MFNMCDGYPSLIYCDGFPSHLSDGNPSHIYQKKMIFWIKEEIHAGIRVDPATVMDIHPKSPVMDIHAPSRLIRDCSLFMTTGSQITFYGKYFRSPLDPLRKFFAIYSISREKISMPTLIGRNNLNMF